MGGVGGPKWRAAGCGVAPHLAEHFLAVLVQIERVLQIGVVRTATFAGDDVAKITADLGAVHHHDRLIGARQAPAVRAGRASAQPSAEAARKLGLAGEHLTFLIGAGDAGGVEVAVLLAQIAGVGLAGDEGHFGVAADTGNARHATIAGMTASATIGIIVHDIYLATIGRVMIAVGMSAITDEAAGSATARRNRATWSWAGRAASATMQRGGLKIDATATASHQRLLTRRNTAAAAANLGATATMPRSIAAAIIDGTAKVLIGLAVDAAAVAFDEAA